ncbi:hypothetical protein BJY59DRAFT_701275 [Rhodotorula toruloides]
MNAATLLSCERSSRAEIVRRREESVESEREGTKGGMGRCEWGWRTCRHLPVASVLPLLKKRRDDSESEGTHRIPLVVAKQHRPPCSLLLADPHLPPHATQVLDRVDIAVVVRGGEVEVFAREEEVDERFGLGVGGERGEGRGNETHPFEQRTRVVRPRSRVNNNLDPPPPLPFLLLVRQTNPLKERRQVRPVSRPLRAFCRV